MDLKKFLDTLVDVDDENYDFSKNFKYSKLHYNQLPDFQKRNPLK